MGHTVLSEDVVEERKLRRKGVKNLIKSSARLRHSRLSTLLGGWLCEPRRRWRKCFGGSALNSGTGKVLLSRLEIVVSALWFVCLSRASRLTFLLLLLCLWFWFSTAMTWVTTTALSQLNEIASKRWFHCLSALDRRYCIATAAGDTKQALPSEQS